MRIPRTLRDLPAYFRYLDMGATGILQLPAYELDNDGYIILYPGEAFCRVAGCPGRRHRYTSSRALRAHLGRHRLRLRPGTRGRMAPETELRMIAWYRGVVVAGAPAAPAAATTAT